MIRTFFVAVIALAAVVVPPAAIPESAPQAQAGTFYEVVYHVHWSNKAGWHSNGPFYSGKYRDYATAQAALKSHQSHKGKHDGYAYYTVGKIVTVSSPYK